MPSTKYTYSIAADTLNAKCSVGSLSQEISSSAILTALDHIETNSDVLDIWMKAALSGGDETILTSVVSAHTGVLPPDVLKTIEGFPIVAPTFEYDEDLTQDWSGYKYTAVKNVLNIFDEPLPGGVKVRGGWFLLLADPASPQAVIGDYLEFSVIDKDDVLGLFTGYGMAPRTDEIQRVIFSAVPSAGTYTLTHNSNTTSAINWDADAAAVQTALRALASLTDVIVTGDTTNDFVVTFTGADGYANHTELTSNDAGLTGATISHSTTTDGYVGDILELSKYVRKQYINPYDISRQVYISLATSTVPSGLFLRTYYNSVGVTNDVDFAISITSYSL